MFDEVIKKIREITSLKPETLVVLGSGLGGFADKLAEHVTINYKELFPYWKADIPGHKGLLHIGLIQEKPVFCMEGRMHYYEGYSDEEMRFPYLLFAKLGVKQTIVTNACGGMNPEYEAGEIMFITDHINMTGHNPLCGMVPESGTSLFCDMSEPYDSGLIELATEIAGKLKIKNHRGIYVGYSGPSYETKAEINAYRNMGGDAVGMSTVPETIVANQTGMKVLGIACITNKATGVAAGKKLSHEEVLSEAERIRMKITGLLTEIIRKI